VLGPLTWNLRQGWVEKVCAWKTWGTPCSFAPAEQKDRYTQSTQSCLDAYFSAKSNPNLRKRSETKSLTFCVYFWQIEPEFEKTEWNKISDFSSSLFLVYQFFWPEGALLKMEQCDDGCVA
jgi:hypothetical protein